MARMDYSMRAFFVLTSPVPLRSCLSPGKEYDDSMTGYRLYMVCSLLLMGGLSLLLITYLALHNCRTDEEEASLPGSPASAFPLSLPDDLPYDSVSWLCSHNAMSNSQDKWAFPNQEWSIARQLEEGIHAQMWDVWEKKGELVLQHGNSHFALPGRLAFSRAAGIVVDYLEKNPDAVVTLILESYVPNEAVRKAFEAAGAGQYCFSLQPGDPWPALGELRRSNKRLVVFTDRPDKDGHWPMPLWTHCVETPWSAKKPEDLENKYNRGKKENKLLIVNHFLTNPIASRKSAETVNTLEKLSERNAQLEKKLGRKGNFWVLDFVETGGGKDFIFSINND